MSNPKTLRIVAATCLALLAVAAAAAQDADPASADRQRDRERVQQQIRQRIEQAPGLDSGQRERMRSNLEQCLRLGLTEDQIEGLFPARGRPDSVDGQALLRYQERVIEAAREGLDSGLLADKAREGRMKGVGAEAIDGALERVQRQLRVAHRAMVQAADDGVTPAADTPTRLQLQRGMALDLWRGLEQGDLDRLRAGARLRSRDGSCSMIELAAASESATELIEAGFERDGAVGLVATALERGLEARELRELGRLTRTAARREQDRGEMLAWMQRRMQRGDPLDATARQMMHQGWLGPRDLAGPGGSSPVDNVIGGPGHQGPGADGGQQHGGAGGPSGPGSSPR
jgi:hypothetical protein